MGFLSSFSEYLNPKKREAKREFYGMTAAEAEAGNAKAQVLYAEMFFSGEGVPQSDIQGIKWLKAAAEQNLISAQIQLANRLHQGLRVQKDFDQGTHWFRRAAELGSAEAQLVLSGMHIDGEGIAQDIPEGIKWAILAAQRKSDYIKCRDDLLGQVSKDQLAEGQRRVAVYRGL
jgi:TPR repeat protein